MKTRSLLPAAMLLCGCFHHAPVVPEPARGPARDSLFEVDRNRTARPTAGFASGGSASLLGRDIIYLRAGAPAAYGAEGVHSLLAAGPPLPEGESWLPLGGGVSDDLRSGYTYGVAAHAGGVGGGSGGNRDAIRFERYIAYWERTAVGPWQIVAYDEIGGPPAGEVVLTPAQTTPPALHLNPARMATIAAVRAADSLFADVGYRLGPTVAFSGAVASTGAVFGAPDLVVGPDAVREFYAKQNGATSLAWHPVYANAAASGDLGFTVGEYVATGRGPSGAAVQRFGKYLTVWKRQKDGTWKFMIDGGNPTR